MVHWLIKSSVSLFLLALIAFPADLFGCQSEPTVKAQSCRATGSLIIDDKTRVMLKSKCPLLAESDISTIISLWQSGYRKVEEATEANRLNVTNPPGDPASCAGETRKVDRWVGFLAGGTWDETLKKCVRVRC